VFGGGCFCRHSCCVFKSRKVATSKSAPKTKQSFPNPSPTTAQPYLPITPDSLYRCSTEFCSLLESTQPSPHACIMSAEGNAPPAYGAGVPSFQEAAVNSKVKNSCINSAHCSELTCISQFLELPTTLSTPDFPRCLLRSQHTAKPPRHSEREGYNDQW
jgi:hypothetical protein